MTTSTKKYRHIFNQQGGVLPVILIISLVALSVMSYVSSRYLSVKRFEKIGKRAQMEKRLKEYFNMATSEMEICSQIIRDQNLNKWKPKQGEPGSYVDLSEFSSLLKVGKQFDGIFKINRIYLELNTNGLDLTNDTNLATDGTSSRFTTHPTKIPLMVDLTDLSQQTTKAFQAASIYVLRKGTNGELLCFGENSYEGLCLAEGGELQDRNTQHLKQDVFDCDLSRRSCSEAGFAYHKDSRSCIAVGQCESHQILVGLDGSLDPSSPSTLKCVSLTGASPWTSADPTTSGACKNGEYVSGISSDGKVTCSAQVNPFNTTKTCNGRLRLETADQTATSAAGFPDPECPASGACLVGTPRCKRVTGMSGAFEVVDFYDCVSPLACN